MDENKVQEMAAQMNEEMQAASTISSGSMSLTFGAAAEEAAPEPPKPAAAVQETADQGADRLSEEEMKMVEEFSKQIDISNTKGVLEYGSGVQKNMAGFSESILQTVKTKDLGEVGDMLSNVISSLEEFDPDAEEEKGFLGFFKKQKKKLTEIKADYDKASVNVDKVASALQGHQVKLLKDIDMMDKMYAQNLDYYKNLTMYIIAGKKAMEDYTNGPLAEAEKKALASGLAEDAQKVKDMGDQLNRFEKKIHDLELTRMIAIQTAPQIRMIQNNDTMMVEKIQSTIVNTIPLWKNQMVLALGLENSIKAADAQAQVTEMTNKLLTENADKLQMATVETAKASERGIVDVETLKHTNQTLINTLDEVKKIQTEGRAKRAQAEQDLRAMEDELKEKLLAMND